MTSYSHTERHDLDGENVALLTHGAPQPRWPERCMFKHCAPCMRAATARRAAALMACNHKTASPSSLTHHLPLTAASSSGKLQVRKAPRPQSLPLHRLVQRVSSGMWPGCCTCLADMTMQFMGSSMPAMQSALHVSQQQLQSNKRAQRATPSGSGRLRIPQDTCAHNQISQSISESTISCLSRLCNPSTRSTCQHDVHYVGKGTGVGIAQMVKAPVCLFASLRTCA